MQHNPYAENLSVAKSYREKITKRPLSQQLEGSFLSTKTSNFYNTITGMADNDKRTINCVPITNHLNDT